VPKGIVGVVASAGNMIQARLDSRIRLNQERNGKEPGILEG
jgi:hypothetical protein